MYDSEKTHTILASVFSKDVQVANLFASAPDLLESLELVEKLRQGVSLYQHEIQNLRISIAKARGVA